jgi:hypothetical protein
MGREWGGAEEGEVSSRATWGRGGRDHTTQREGFQASEGGIKGESARGAKEGFAPHLYCQSVYVYIIIV